MCFSNPLSPGECAGAAVRDPRGTAAPWFILFTSIAGSFSLSSRQLLLPVCPERDRESEGEGEETEWPCKARLDRWECFTIDPQEFTGKATQ